MEPSEKVGFIQIWCCKINLASDGAPLKTFEQENDMIQDMF